METLDGFILNNTLFPGQVFPVRIIAGKIMITSFLSDAS